MDTVESRKVYDRTVFPSGNHWPAPLASIYILTVGNKKLS